MALTTITPSATSARDKAFQDAAGNVTTNPASPTVLSAVGTIIGFRFRSITIPPGTPIVRAYLQVNVSDVANTNALERIFAQADTTPAQFSPTLNNLGTGVRPVMGGCTSWYAPNLSLAAHATTDVTELVQGLVSSAGWASGNNAVFLIKHIPGSATGLGLSLPTSFLVITYDSDATVKGPGVLVGYTGAAPVGKAVTRWADDCTGSGAPPYDQGLLTAPALDTHFSLSYTGGKLRATGDLTGTDGSGSGRTVYFPTGMADMAAGEVHSIFRGESALAQQGHAHLIQAVPNGYRALVIDKNTYALAENTFAGWEMSIVGWQGYSSGTDQPYGSYTPLESSGDSIDMSGVVGPLPVTTYNWHFKTRLFGSVIQAKLWLVSDLAEPAWVPGNGHCWEWNVPPQWVGQVGKFGYVINHLQPGQTSDVNGLYISELFNVLVDTPVTSTDTGTGTDVETHGPGSTEPGTATDTGSITAVALTASDSGTGTDSQGLSTIKGVARFDSAAVPFDSSEWGFDGYTSLPQDEDAGVGSESSSGTATASSSDTGTGTEAGSIGATLSSSDSGTASDTYSLVITVLDTEDGLATESESVTTAGSQTDAGVGTDSGTVAATLSSSDSGLGTEAGTVGATLSSSDTGTGVETGTVGVPVTSTDTGTATETGVVVRTQLNLGPPLEAEIPATRTSVALSSSATEVLISSSRTEAEVDDQALEVDLELSKTEAALL